MSRPEAVQHALDLVFRAVNDAQCAREGIGAVAGAISATNTPDLGACRLQLALARRDLRTAECAVDEALRFLMGVPS